MTKRGYASSISLAAVVWMVGAAAPLAKACPVCFGDPDAPMAQAASRGILVLLGFITLVLTSIVGIGGCWVVRARKLHATDKNAPKSMFLSE